jgi:hypothetical protein
MTVLAKLALFAGALAAVLAVGAVAGAAVGPSPAATEAEPPMPIGAGVSMAEDGYQLRPLDELTAIGGRFRFVVLDAKGHPVRRFDAVHEKELHLIVVNRELTDYHHLHPALDADGTWSIDLPALAPGPYRFVADFEVHDGPRLALGYDLAIAGQYEPARLPPVSNTSIIDGYEVTLENKQGDGGVNTIAFTVRHDGALVSDLQPYLGAQGHLIAMRIGDLAYSHVHPLRERPDDPSVRFEATLSSAGQYRLFFDFRHGDIVRTASFTFEQRLVSGNAPAMEHS